MSTLQRMTGRHCCARKRDAVANTSRAKLPALHSVRLFCGSRHQRTKRETAREIHASNTSPSRRVQRTLLSLVASRSPGPPLSLKNQNQACSPPVRCRGAWSALRRPRHPDRPRGRRSCGESGPRYASRVELLVGHLQRRVRGIGRPGTATVRLMPLDERGRFSTKHVREVFRQRFVLAVTPFIGMLYSTPPLGAGQVGCAPALSRARVFVDNRRRFGWNCGCRADGAICQTQPVTYASRVFWPAEASIARRHPATVLSGSHAVVLYGPKPLVGAPVSSPARVGLQNGCVT